MVGGAYLRVSFETKGDFKNIDRWLDSAIKHNPSKTLNLVAEQGVENLRNNTPVDTGETASSWTSEITKRGDIYEVIWRNTAHSEAEVNVAKIIEFGHGLINGGYIPPRPYIKDAMKPIFKYADNKLVKELIK